MSISYNIKYDLVIKFDKDWINQKETLVFYCFECENQYRWTQYSFTPIIKFSAIYQMYSKKKTAPF